jgi:hypothetical protein
MFDFDEDPLPDAWNRWGLGVAVPVVLTISAASVMTRNAVHIPGRRGGLNLQGHDVTALAVLLFAVAILCFAHFYGTERYHFVRQLTRLAAMIGGLIAIGAIIVHQAVPF